MGDGGGQILRDGIEFCVAGDAGTSNCHAVSGAVKSLQIRANPYDDAGSAIAQRQGFIQARQDSIHCGLQAVGSYLGEDFLYEIGPILSLGGERFPRELNHHPLGSS